MAGDRAGDALDRGRLGVDRIVEGERPVDDGAFDLPTVGHLAQGRRVQRRRHVGVDGLHGGQHSDARLGHAQRMGAVDGIADDIGLGGQVRCDVDGRVGNEERARIGRNIHDEDMRHATIGAQALGAVHALAGLEAIRQVGDLVLQ